jgi:hypothetical protein
MAATRRVTRLQNQKHSLRGLMLVRAVFWFDQPSKPIAIQRTLLNASAIVGTAHPLSDQEKQDIIDGNVIEELVEVPFPDDASDATVQAHLDSLWTRADNALIAAVKEGGSYGAFSDATGAWSK